MQIVMLLLLACSILLHGLSTNFYYSLWHHAMFVWLIVRPEYSNHELNHSRVRQMAMLLDVGR